MDVDTIAERIIQMIGFLFLNRINNTSDNVNIKFTKMDRLIFTNLDRII